MFGPPCQKGIVMNGCSKKGGFRDNISRGLGRYFPLLQTGSLRKYLANQKSQSLKFKVMGLNYP